MSFKFFFISTVKCCWDLVETISFFIKGTAATAVTLITMSVSCMYRLLFAVVIYSMLSWAFIYFYVSLEERFEVWIKRVTLHLTWWMCGVLCWLFFSGCVRLDICKIWGVSSQGTVLDWYGFKNWRFEKSFRIFFSLQNLVPTWVEKFKFITEYFINYKRFILFYQFWYSLKYFHWNLKNLIDHSFISNYFIYPKSAITLNKFPKISNQLPSPLSSESIFTCQRILSAYLKRQHIKQHRMSVKLEIYSFVSHTFSSYSYSFHFSYFPFLWTS